MLGHNAHARAPIGRRQPGEATRTSSAANAGVAHSHHPEAGGIPMTRTLRAAAALAAAAVALATASIVQAAPAARVCPSFKQGRLTLTSFTLGTSWTCAAAKSWIVKLSNDHIRISTKNVPLANGPRGYHCFATPFSRGGRATSGSCIKGTIAFPGSGFAWNTA